MEVIKFKELSSGDSFAGVTCVQSVSIAQTRNGKDYATGTVLDGETSVQFKVWDTTTVAYLKDALAGGLTSMVLATVGGAVGMYQGNLDYTFNSVILNNANIPTTITLAQFLPSLDCAALYKQLTDFINTNCSAGWINVLLAVTGLDSSVFTGETTKTGVTLNELLKTGWAASKYHDSIAGGLLNHTCKMLRLAQCLLNNGLPHLEEYKDLIYTGIILHDIGKVQEICNGAYTKNSFISHRVMGIEYLAMCKSAIVQNVGIDSYTRLLSIIIGHHDKYGTPADTVWAYLVHLIDNLDAFATTLDDTLSGGNVSVSTSGDAFIRRDDSRLFI